MLSMLIAAASSATVLASATPGAVQPLQSAIEADPFLLDAPLSDAAMSATSGGEAAAVDISQLGLNIASTAGTISGVSVSGGSDTGAIANNAVNGNSGITAVFNNTGNGVIFQNTVQVNVFLNGAQ